MASNAVRIAILANASQAKAALNETGSAAERLGKRTSKVGGLLKGALVGGGIIAGAAALTGAFKRAADAVQLQQQLMNQTKAVLKSTGNAAGTSAKGVLALSDALEKKSLIDSEEIQKGQNLLLTFTNVRNEAGKGNDIFTQTTKTLVDMSTALGQDTKASAIQLGKALNDPVKGVTALSKVGVSFTAGQKKTIASLVKSGDTLGAQKVILKELNKEFGGSAAAAGKTAAGQFKHFRDVIDGVFEAIVKRAVPILLKIIGFLQSNFPKAVSAVQPYIDKLKSAFASVKSALEPVFNFLKANPAVVKAFAITLGILAAAVGVASAAVGIFNAVLALNPISLVVIAIAALVAGFVYAYTHFETFRNIADKVFNAFKAVVSAVLPIVGTIIKTYFTVYLSVIKTVFNVILAVVRTTWSLFKSLIVTPVKAVASFISSAVSGIGSSIKSAWDNVTTWTRTAWTGLKGVITTAWTKIVTFLKNIPSKVKTAIGDLGSVLANAGKALIGGLIDGIKSKVGDVKDALVGLTDKLTSWKGPPKKDAVLLRPAGRSIIGGLIKGFEDTEPAVESTLAALTAKIRKALDGAREARALKSIRDESKALLANARAADAVRAKLTDARKALADMRKEAADYAASISDSVTKSADVTSVLNGSNALSAGGVVSSIIGNLQDRISLAVRFNGLLQQLTSRGLNKTALQQIIDAGIDGGLATADALANSSDNAIAQINDLQTQLGKAGTALGATSSHVMYDAGIQAAQGLVNGLASQATALDRVGRRLAAALVKAVKKALGIHSPSRVFKGLGLDTVRGLKIGLDETYVKRQGGVVASSLVDGFASPKLSASTAFAQALSSSSNQSVAVRLTAEQLTQLQRGKMIQADLDFARGVGVRQKVAS